jgi:hypothetical protein
MRPQKQNQNKTKKHQSFLELKSDSKTVIETFILNALLR